MGDITKTRRFSIIEYVAENGIRSIHIGEERYINTKIVPTAKQIVRVLSFEENSQVHTLIQQLSKDSIWDILSTVLDEELHTEYLN